MYQLFYWYMSPTLMCTFANYSDAKLALQVLQKKYPTCKIYIKPVIAINSFEEWEDKFNGEIEDYKNSQL